MESGQLISSNGSSHSINDGNILHRKDDTGDGSTSEDTKPRIIRRSVPSTDFNISSTSNNMIERPESNSDDPSRPLLLTSAPEDR